MNDEADLDRRRRAEIFGRLSETMCALFLSIKGYRILARDYRARVGEIDIVARKDRTLAFVEVKARVRAESADLITRRQQARIMRAAEAFLASRPHLRDLDVRFDAIFVRPWRIPVHIADAWQADSGLGQRKSRHSSS